VKVKDVQEEKGPATVPEAGPVQFDIAQMYAFDPRDATPDITVVRYSNLAYVQVTPRDVYIDFLEMPGVKRDGGVAVNGTRVYMSFVAAKRLSEVLAGILEQVHDKGAMEQYATSSKVAKGKR
jgi:hypothetical protein